MTSNNKITKLFSALINKLVACLFILFFLSLFLGFPRVTYAALETCTFDNGPFTISNLTITPSNGPPYDYNTVFTVAGQIDCVPYPINGPAAGTTGYVRLVNTVINDSPAEERLKYFPITGGNPVPALRQLRTIPAGSSESDATGFTFNPIVFTLDPYIDQGTGDLKDADEFKKIGTYDPKVWYLLFETLDNAVVRYNISPPASLPEDITLNGNVITITLRPAAENEEDIPTDEAHLVLKCGDPVRLGTPTCPSDKPCCPSACGTTLVEPMEGSNGGTFCGYDASAIVNQEPTATPPLQQCQTETGKVPGSCNTALGRISSDPGGFITSLLGILLSMSGMIALFLIIRSGYQLMMSRGNPEAIQEAKERLTSAIVGLLLIIFSLVIMSIIGVNILRLPGFE